MTACLKLRDASTSVSSFFLSKLLTQLSKTTAIVLFSLGLSL